MLDGGARARRQSSSISRYMRQALEGPCSFYWPKSLTNCCCGQPGGHLFLSTISRTALAYFLTIFMAEDVLRKVSRGTHTHAKFIRPDELTAFFRAYPNTKSPWVAAGRGPPTRTQAEIRGLIYNPLRAGWVLAPRDAWGAAECNYLFWVRKPLVEPTHNDT